jgi:alkanesulfonate monooxygenase SsuD/methylene tetrahydromethanopterin reductase-like flavin-dependent oxidoreductase (luciferase family)
MPVHIGIKTPPQAVDFPTLDAAWREIGRHDVFESAWINDHLVDPRLPRGGPGLEALTVLAALAHHVPGKWLGIAVLSATFRHPAVLAKQLTVLDHVTGGRLIVGLGAGWHESEHIPFGIPFPPIVERFDRFESAVGVLRALWSDAARRQPGVDLADPFYPLSGATNEPGMLGPDSPQLWLGGQRRRGIDLAARYGRGWVIPNLLPDGRTDRLAYFVEHRTRLLERMAEVGRDPRGFGFGMQVPTGTTAAERAEGVRLGVDSAAAGATHLILSMPATLGAPGIELVAREIALPLREAVG